MFYLFLIGIFFLTQQGIKGALDRPNVPEPEIASCVPYAQELAQAEKELQRLAGLWVIYSERGYSETAYKEERKKTNGFFSFLKKKEKPTKNDLCLLNIACQYTKLRKKHPELPEHEAIEFFITNATVNGPIEKFPFNNPYSPATVTRESGGAYHAAVTWSNHPDYAQFELDPETGSIIVVYPKVSRRGRSNTSPAPVEPESRLVGQSRRPNRAERGLSLPANPAAHEFFQELPKAESGYGSGQSVAPKALAFSQKAGATFFAEV